MINQIAPADIQHRAERDERAEADIFLQAPIQNRRAERAALAQKTDAAWFRHVGGERGVELGAGNHHAQTVRADNADVAAPGFFENLLLQRRTFRTRFLEAGGDDDHAMNAGGGTFLDDARHGFRRRDDDGEVGNFRQRGDVRIRLDPENHFLNRIAGKNFAGKTAGHQIAHHRATDAALALRRADDRNGFRCQDRIEWPPPDLMQDVMSRFERFGRNNWISHIRRLIQTQAASEKAG